MKSTFPIRTKFLDIARQDVGKKELSKNQAPWIAKFWTATSYPKGHENREPYCAAAMCYWMMRWLSNEEVLQAFGFTPKGAEAWRCKSASVFRDPDSNWLKWAKTHGLTILPPHCILHSADIAIYSYSHIELVSNDDGTDDGPFTAIGANTNPAGSADGDGCWEKPRSRKNIQCFIRPLP
jgi:hypothetical protein